MRPRWAFHAGWSAGAAGRGADGGRTRRTRRARWSCGVCSWRCRFAELMTDRRAHRRPATRGRSVRPRRGGEGAGAPRSRSSRPPRGSAGRAVEHYPDDTRWRDDRAAGRAARRRHYARPRRGARAGGPSGPWTPARRGAGALRVMLAGASAGDPSTAARRAHRATRWTPARTTGSRIRSGRRSHTPPGSTWRSRPRSPRSAAALNLGVVAALGSPSPSPRCLVVRVPERPSRWRGGQPRATQDLDLHPRRSREQPTLRTIGRPVAARRSRRSRRRIIGGSNASAPTRGRRR